VPLGEVQGGPPTDIVKFLEEKKDASSETKWRDCIAVFACIMVTILSSTGFWWQHHQRQTVAVLFVGNSFTYGPPSYGSNLTTHEMGIDLPQASNGVGGMTQLNNVPKLFKLIAKSLNKQVDIGEDTIGGCTLWAHRPSYNPDFAEDPNPELPFGYQHVDSKRVPGYQDCTVRSNIGIDSAYQKECYSPCPQNINRASWDFAVLQDISWMPSLSAHRELLMIPAIKEYMEAAKDSDTKVVMYSTWGYFNSSTAFQSCPKPAPKIKTGCYPEGVGPDVIAARSGGSNGCGDLDIKHKDFTCMVYSVLRAYWSAMEKAGADMVAPVGAAWHIMQGAPPLDAECADVIDRDYPPNEPSPFPHWAAEQAKTAAEVLPKDWNIPGQHMYRAVGPDTKAAQTHEYCDTCDPPIDHHPSIIGSYMNALVIYTTIFKESPVGAAIPSGITKEEAEVAQRVAAAVVLKNVTLWDKDATENGPDEGHGD